MAVLVTGASGYIGHHLTKRLVENGETVVAYLRPSSETERLQTLGGTVQLLSGNGTQEDLSGLFSDNDIETVFHLAAHRPGFDEDRDDILEANISFSMRLWNAAFHAECQAFINTGSYWQFDADGNKAPNSYYAETKQAFQDFLDGEAADDTPAAATLVLFDVYGPGDWRGGVTQVLARAAKGEAIDMSGGEQVLDMVHVSDVADGFIQAAKSLATGPGHRTWFLGSGHRASLRDIAALYGQVSGRTLAINWGVLDYRPNQIFQPCPAAPSLPGWTAARSLEAGFAELAGELPLSNKV